MINKGAFGLFNYKDTILDADRKEDSRTKQYGKAFLQGVCDGIFINGVIYTGAVLFVAAKRLIK